MSWAPRQACVSGSVVQLVFSSRAERRSEVDFEAEEAMERMAVMRVENGMLNERLLN